MSYFSIIGSILLIHLLAVMSPGPDFIITVKNALNHSRSIGIWTAVGIALGIIVHVSYCVAGLALLISKSVLIFNTIKFAGALYLIYLGIVSFKNADNTFKVNKSAHRQTVSPIRALWMGFLTNILNPKATLFFLSLFTFAISPETPSHVIGIISVLLVINTGLWFILVSIFFSNKKIQTAFFKSQKIFNRILGGLLVALGIRVLLD